MSWEGGRRGGGTRGRRPRRHPEIGFLSCWPPQASLPAISRLLRRERGAGGVGGDGPLRHKIRGVGWRCRSRTRARGGDGIEGAGPAGGGSLKRGRAPPRLTAVSPASHRDDDADCPARRMPRASMRSRLSPRVRGECGGYGPVPACAFGDACWYSARHRGAQCTQEMRRSNRDPGWSWRAVRAGDELSASL